MGIRFPLTFSPRPPPRGFPPEGVPGCIPVAVPCQGEAWRWRRRAWRWSRSLPLSNGPLAGPFDGGESRLPLRLLLPLPMPVLGLGPALALNCGRRFLGDHWGGIG